MDTYSLRPDTEAFSVILPANSLNAAAYRTTIPPIQQYLSLVAKQFYNTETKNQLNS